MNDEHGPLHSENEGSRRIGAYLSAEKVDASLVATGVDMPTVPVAAAALGVHEARVVKSIVFQGKKDSSRVVLAIACGDTRVASSKVAAALGTAPLKLATPETVLSVTGYAVGGVPPIGHVNRVPVVVDVNVLAHDTVYGGGGDEQHMLRISPREIVRLAGAVVADIKADAAGTTT
jgi:Cys-tRNA(Pro) deacylase